jgi:endonuclease/exonuclease/phosphatase family metal-dependent hydrolase
MISKRSVFLAALLLVVLFSYAQTVTFLTFNIRYDNPGDGKNSWPARRSWLCEQIRSATPGIFGIQEGLSGQVRYLDSVFTEFRHIGVGREDGKNAGEFSAIFYDTAKFTMVKQSTFWLSPTPNKVSRGWDAALERICTYGLFEEIISGSRFWLFNTHFDHVGSVARLKSAELILKKIKQLNKKGYPVVLMGDLNCEPDSAPVVLLTHTLTDAVTADKSMGMRPGGTFNGFDPAKPSTERIDYILTGYRSYPGSYHVIRECRDGRYASDHFAVFAEVSW